MEESRHLSAVSLNISQPVTAGPHQWGRRNTVVFDGQTISLGCWASRVRLGVGAGGVDAAAYPL